MFRRTIVRPAPVVTLLTGSVKHSIRVASLLRSLAPTTIEVVEGIDLGVAGTADSLDQTLKSSSSIFGLLGQRRRPKKTPIVVWNSVAVRCTNSGSVLHLLSQGARNDDVEVDKKLTLTAPETTTQPLQLVAITNSDRNSTGGRSVGDAISGARDIIAEEILKNRQSSTTTSRLFSSLKNTIANYRNPSGSSTTAWEILSGDNLPILSLPTKSTTPATSVVNSGSSTSSQKAPYLKEIVIPSFDFASYEDGSTIFTSLSFSEAMKRVVTGVYQWPDSLTSIRPLPTSAEDRRLPSPSFIFFHDDVDRTVANVTSSRRYAGGDGDDSGYVMTAARIGYGGLGDGQVMLQHPDLLGLDVRLCPKPNVSPAFSEAQESLLAASMDELQNANTLNAGRSDEAKDDERVGKGDCWVEVRANLKQPGGFFRSGGTGGVTVTRSSSRKQRIAKIPDIPYE